MSRLHVRHLVQQPGRHGPRWYWQPSASLRAKGWKTQRLNAATEAEAMALAEAINADLDAWRLQQGATSKPKAPGGSVAGMIEAYRASKWWPKGERTRKDYGYYLAAIERWAGDMTPRAITAKAVQAFHDMMASRVEGKGRKRRTIHTPARAAAAVRVLSALLSAGKRLGFVPENVALGAGVSVERQREPVLWTRAQLDHLVATADAMGWRSQATAMLLNYWCGQRQADILKLAPWTIEQGAVTLRQGKRGRKVSLPLHLVPELVARLEGERTRAGNLASLTHLLLHENTGRPWQGYTFTHVFAEIRALAAKGGELRQADGSILVLKPMPACAALRWMELRHTAVTALHLAGLDPLAISSITGHTPQSVTAILDRHYLVRTSEAAERAFRARLEREGKGA